MTFTVCVFDSAFVAPKVISLDALLLVCVWCSDFCFVGLELEWKSRQEKTS